ncbi:hypothetical protein P4O66_017482, partial [Electrophorus voltai]
MVLIDSYIFNKIEWIRFNSTVGKYVGYTKFGIYNAERWNNNTAHLQEERTNLDAFCKYNAEIYYPRIMDKTVEPRVKVMSVKQASGNHPAMLMCSAYNFYPNTIKVSWLRDGKPVTSAPLRSWLMETGTTRSTPTWSTHPNLGRRSPVWWSTPASRNPWCTTGTRLFLSLRGTRLLLELQGWCWGSSYQLLDSSTTRGNPQDLT